MKAERINRGMRWNNRDFPQKPVIREVKQQAKCTDEDYQALHGVFTSDGMRLLIHEIHL
jgi:hypothetical protein